MSVNMFYKVKLFTSAERMSLTRAMSFFLSSVITDQVDSAIRETWLLHLERLFCLMKLLLLANMRGYVMLRIMIIRGNDQGRLAVLEIHYPTQFSCSTS